MRSSVLNTIEIFWAKFASKPINILVSIQVANLLGPDDKGVTTWVVVLVNVASYIFSFGCGSAIRYLCAGKNKNLKDVAWTTVVIGLANGAVGSLLAAILIRFDLLGKVTREVSDGAQWAIVASIPHLVVDSILSRALVGEQQYRFVNLLEIIGSMFYSLLLFILVSICHYGIFGANLAFFASKIITALATIIYVFSVYSPTFCFNRDVFFQSYNYGLRSWLGGLLVVLSAYIDSFFIGMALNSSQLGNYSIAAALAKVPLLIPISINPVLINRLIGEHKTKATSDAAMIHRLTFWMVLLVSIVFSLIVYILMPRLLPQYLDAPSIFLILIIGTIFSGSSIILGAFFASQGMPGRSSLSQLFACLLGLLLTPVMVHHWQSVGGAISSVLSNLVFFIAMCGFFLAETRIGGSWLFKIRFVDFLWLNSRVKQVCLMLKLKKN